MKPLAFIIITYNRPEDLYALLKNIVQLDDAAELIEEIIIVNNASTTDYGEVEGFVQSRPDIPFRYIFSQENLGVTKGRNFAIAKSSAPILILIDDDAELENKDCLKNIIAEFEKKTKKPIAIVSFKVLYYDTHQMQKNALPHKQYNEYKDKPFFETYYYAGGAHAIKRDVLEKVGTYPEDFFYGMEEYDLSYRILDAGYSIVYSAGIVMLHKESPLGRKPKAEKLRMMWVNKSKVAWRYLPKKYFYSTAVLWSLQYLYITRFQFGNFIKGWKQVFQIQHTERPNKIRPETVRYLKSLNARLWY
ncbi:MAG TPA: glycosyltransferase family 2 protein [Chitinophagaceae bacterium]|nr:glycosyltransferase family 2 protein [Chitinophagaceae bacterium]